MHGAKLVHGQGALKVYGNRALHFEAFSDAVFELIDLYTPTTKLDQYVGYIRALFRAIVKRGREWRYCWPVTARSWRAQVEFFYSTCYRQGTAWEFVGNPACPACEAANASTVPW